MSEGITLKRIIDMDEAAELTSSDYALVDSATGGPKKFAIGEALGEIKDGFNQIGDLSQLETETKTDLVSAINEVKNSGGTGGGLDKTAIDLLETILVSALYKVDQSATISQLIQHLSALLPISDEIEKVGSALRISNLKTAPTQDGSTLIIQ